MKQIIFDLYFVKMGRITGNLSIFQTIKTEIS